MTNLTTSLTIPIGAEDYDSVGLVLELDKIVPILGNPAGIATIRQYPPVRAELFASVGTVEKLGIEREKIEAELIRFSQSATANTSKIMDSSVKITNKWALDISSGKSVRGLRFTPKLGTTIVEASEAFTGVILITYTSSYRELEYEFEFEPEGVLDLASNPNAVFSPEFGILNFFSATILAYYEGATASLELTPPVNNNRTATEMIEIYKVISRVVVNSDGAWERPDEWPDKNTYKNYPGFTGPDIGDAYVEHERVHEVGFVDDFGRFTFNSFFTLARKPFGQNYKIPYEFSSSCSASDASDATCSVRYSDIINRLKANYGFTDSAISRFGCF